MSSRIHLRNLAFNWGGHASTLLVMFFLSPYIIGKLDAVSYGIWSLLNVLTGYMGIFDLGVRASVGRHVALYLGKNDTRGVDETIRAGFGFFSFAGLLILVIGTLLGYFFPTLFEGVSPHQYVTVRFLLMMMVVNIWISATASIFSSVLSAYDRFDIARCIDLFVLLVRTVGTIITLELGWGLWGLVSALILGNICALLGNRIYAGRIHKDLRCFPFIYSKERLKELFGYGIPSFLTHAAVKIAGQSDLVIVGIFLSVSEVREYSVGAMLIYYTTTFLRIITRTYFPAIQRFAAQGNQKEVYDLFSKQLKISFIAGIVVYGGYTFYSRPFIELWMLQPSFNYESVVSSASVMSILAVSCLPLLVVTPCISVLSAIGYVGFTAKVSIVESILNVFLSVIFVTHFNMGLSGVAFGTLISRFFITGVFIPISFCKSMGKSVSSLIRLVFPFVVCLFVYSCVCYFSVRFLHISDWLRFSINIAVVGIFGILTSMMIAAPDLFKKVLLKLK